MYTRQAGLMLTGLSLCAVMAFPIRLSASEAKEQKSRSAAEVPPKDPEEAAAWAATLEDGNRKCEALRDVASAWARKDPEKAAAISQTCLSCGRCQVRCPMQIDTPAMMVAVKRLAEEGSPDA